MSIVLNQVFPAGQVVTTSRIFYAHWGIVTDRWENGEQVVISNSGHRNMVVEEPMSVFRRGLSIEPRIFSSALEPQDVLMRARQKLGQTYDLINWNCEHFVYESFGLPKQSPQLAAFAACAIGMLLFR